VTGELTTYVVSDRFARDGVRAERLLFLLHGYGATEHDLTAIGPLLDPDGHVLVAGARGPHAAEGGAAWFTPTPLGPDPDSLLASLAALHVTLDALCAEHLLGRDEVIVGGFSQGAAMALALAFGTSDRPAPAGVLCLSGFLADARGLEYDWGRPAPPVLVQHGSLDEVVPVDLGRDTAALLGMHHVPVTYQQYDMGHQTTVESLADARTWLARVRDGERPASPVA
jgi:phospholipase/carboxylesterase